VLTFSISGANAQTGQATTLADGTAAFVYTGAHDGTDQVQVSFTSGTLKIASNTVQWLGDAGVPASVGTSHCDFFTTPASATTFVAKPGDSRHSAWTPRTSRSTRRPGRCEQLHQGRHRDPAVHRCGDRPGRQRAGTIRPPDPGTPPGGRPGRVRRLLPGDVHHRKPGDVTFSVNAASGFLLGVGGRPARQRRLRRQPAGHRAVHRVRHGRANAAAGTNTAAQNVTVHFPNAGTFPFELDGSRSGARLPSHWC